MNNEINDNNKTKYKIFVVILMIFILTFGIFVGLSITYNNSVSDDLTSYTPEDMEEDLKNFSNEQAESVNSKNHDIEVTYIDNYTLCNEQVKSSNVVYSTTLEDVKKEEEIKQVRENKRYDLIEESNDTLVYSRDVNQNCPNHFCVKLENGKVNIYNVVSKDVNTIYKSVDISEELIRSELIEELTKGILANSKEELNLIIEDIES